MVVLMEVFEQIEDILTNVQHIQSDTDWLLFVTVLDGLLLLILIGLVILVLRDKKKG